MSDQPAPALPPKKPRSRTPIIIGAVAAVAVVAAVGIAIAAATSNTGGGAGSGGPSTGTGGSDAAASEWAGQTVNIGVADESQAYWDTYIDLVQDELGVTVELTNFSDYSQPNPALSQGQLDLNQFQHILYLANYNVTTGDDLQPIGATAIYPLPLYSSQYASVEELPDGAVVAIPNDAINQARGLLVLQSAGLVELADGGNAFSDINDVTSSRVQITPLSADQTAGALQSGSAAAAIVNKNYATDAGLPQDQVIAADDPEDPAAAAYVNVFASRADDAENELYLRLAELYHDPSVEEGVQEANGGTAVFQTTPAADLQAALAEVEDDARAAQG